MWNRFTQSARRCILYAQWEAERGGTRFVCSEHLLLGLCREATSGPDRPPAKAPTWAERLRRLAGRGAEEEAPVSDSGLARLGLDWPALRAQVERGVLWGLGAGGDMQLSRRGRRILELAYDEARQMGQSGIAPEHLLLGVLREGEGTGAKILRHRGVELETLRRWVQKPQSGVLVRGASAPPAPEEQLLRPARYENDPETKSLLHPGFSGKAKIGRNTATK